MSGRDTAQEQTGKKKKKCVALFWQTLKVTQTNRMLNILQCFLMSSCAFSNPGIRRNSWQNQWVKKWTIIYNKWVEVLSSAAVEKSLLFTSEGKKNIVQFTFSNCLVKSLFRCFSEIKHSETMKSLLLTNFDIGAAGISVLPQCSEEDLKCNHQSAPYAALRGALTAWSLQKIEISCQEPNKHVSSAATFRFTDSEPPAVKRTWRSFVVPSLSSGLEGQQQECSCRLNHSRCVKRCLGDEAEMKQENKWIRSRRIPSEC